MINRTWQLSASKVEDIGSKNYVKRALKRDIDARAIKGEVEEITWSIHSFMVCSSRPILSCKLSLIDSIRLRVC